MVSRWLLGTIKHSQALVLKNQVLSVLHRIKLIGHHILCSLWNDMI